MIKKKLLALILVLVVIFVLSGCTDAKKYDDEELMVKDVFGTWFSYDNDIVFILNGHQYSKYDCSEFLLQDIVDENLSGEKQLFDENTDNEITNDITLQTGSITYNIKKGIISCDGCSLYVYEDEYGDIRLREVDDDGIEYFKESDLNLTPPKKYIDAYKTLKEKALWKEEKALWKEKIANLPSAKEFKYDTYSYVGDDFFIDGTAVLDDYYNWNFSNWEPLYYSIRVTPIDGGFDSWYIYANRSDKNFEELFEKLKSGSVSVSMICDPWLGGGYEHDMAILVDYIIN